MRRFLSEYGDLLILIGCIVLSIACSICSAQAHGAESKHMNTLAFTAKWCPACQANKPEIARLQKQGFDIQVVDIDQDRKLWREHGNGFVPLYVVLVDGKVVLKTNKISELKKFLVKQ
jgi:thiol-disulfide isomerase/thioredoxin